MRPVLVLLSKPTARCRSQGVVPAKIGSLVEFAVTQDSLRWRSFRSQPTPDAIRGVEKVFKWMCARQERAPVIEPAGTGRSGRVSHDRSDGRIVKSGVVLAGLPGHRKTRTWR